MLSLAPSGGNVEHWDRQLQALGVAASLTTAVFGAPHAADGKPH
jgi:hypothetical protein